MNVLNRIVLVSLALILAGCGDDGPARYNLSGKVTYNDQVVPYGTILFSPDTSQGNSGPGSAATIRDGAYKTMADKGVVGGPHRVTITGYLTPLDGTVAEEDVQEMFSTYQTTADLPRGDSEFDFNIPAPTP